MDNTSKNIITLWEGEKLPVLNGLIKADNSYFALNDNGILKASPLPDFNSFIISAVDILASAKTDNFTIFAGEGSWGSDGWIYCLNKDNNFCWLFSGAINPIIKIEFDEKYVYAFNNNHVQMVIPFLQPEAMIKG